MVSFKKGVLKVTNDEETARQVFDCCFVANVLSLFVFYEVKLVSSIAALLLLGSSILIWVGRKNRKVVIPYNTVWYIIIILYSAASSLWSSYLSKTIYSTLMRMAVILAIITAISIYVETAEHLERLMSLFIFSMVIITILEFSSVSPSLWFSGKMGEHFSGCNANEVAFWSTCAEMMAFYKYYIKRQKKYIILVIVFYVFVVASSSRKATVAGLAAPSAIIAFSTFKKNYIFKIILMLLAIVFIFNFIMTNETAYNAVGVRFNSLFRFIGDDSQRYDYSMYLRTYYKDVAKELFTESPILGKGLNNFSKIIDIDYGWQQAYSHSNHWQLLSELGIVGFILYYFFYAFCIIRLARDMIVNKSRISIMYISLLLLLFFLESAMVTFNSKTTQLVVAMAYTATYVGIDDGRQYKYIQNNVNGQEE